MLGNKILYRVIGEEFAQFTAKLGGEGFIMSENESGTVGAGNNICHIKSFARAGYTKKRLLFMTKIKTLYKRINGLWLIARRLIIRNQLNLSIRTAPFPKFAK